jgi:asparagine synthase (glutamine-hydrolysing)
MSRLRFDIKPTMRSFAAVFSRLGAPPEQHTVQRDTDQRGRPAGDAISNRRPGDWWTYGEVAMRYLPSAGIESMRDEDVFRPMAADGIAVLADARFDFGDQRHGATDAPSPRLGDSSDALVHMAYRRWGAAWVDHVQGDFATVIWDRNTRTLYCHRDRLGCKPLYFTLTDALCCVASEVRTLLSLASVDPAINEAKIADYLVPPLEGADIQETFYRHIHALLPSHHLRVTPQRADRRRYWSLAAPDRPFSGSTEDAVTDFRQLLAQSIGRRLQNARRPASMLSGGLDSSAIAVFSARQLPPAQDRLPVILAASEHSDAQSDTRHARQVAGACPHARLIEVMPNDLADYSDRLEDYLARITDLFDANIAHVPFAVYSRAASSAFDVVFDGIDGDAVTSLTTGYVGYLWRQGRFVHGAREACLYSRRYYAGALSSGRIMKDAACMAFAPYSIPSGLSRFIRRWRTHAWSTREIRDSAINPDFAATIVPARFEMLSSHWRPRAESLEQQQVQRLTHPYLTVGLARYERMARFFGIEARHPFSDMDLIEFCLSLPWRLKVSNGWSKYILRRALVGTLPNAVIWRRGWDHHGYLFQQYWYTHWRGRMIGVVDGHMDLLSCYMDRSKLRRSIVMAGKETASLIDLDHLWQAMTLCIWLKSRGPNHPGPALRY